MRKERKIYLAMYLVLLDKQSTPVLCVRERENVGETNKLQACNLKTSGFILFKVMLL